MLMFIEEGVRGGVSQISHRFASAAVSCWENQCKNLYESTNLRGLRNFRTVKIPHVQIPLKIYQNNVSRACNLAFPDTDSLTYHTKHLWWYATKCYNFDFSDYPKNHSLYSDTNKKTIEKFKDEMCGQSVFEFVGLEGKMYSTKSSEGEKKRAKGISTRVVRKRLTHQDYVDWNFNKTSMYQSQTNFRKINPHLFTAKQNRKSPFDDHCICQTRLKFCTYFFLNIFTYGYCVKILKMYKKMYKYLYLYTIIITCESVSELKYEFCI